MLRMLEQQPLAANYGQSRLQMAKRASAGRYWRKEIPPHRGFFTFPSWIKNAREEEGLQAFG